MHHHCPLCGGPLTFFNNTRKRDYLRCSICDAISMDPAFRLHPDLEKARYLEHNNDVEDLGYQRFVSPIVNAVLKNFHPHHKGLDFGAGTGPVIAKLLKDKHYNISLYDPFFADDTSLLCKSYDYIVACEVIEHFYRPDQEFALLKRLLNPDGKLILMTALYDDNVDFSTWHYKNDETHVFFYTTKTLVYIQQNYGFSQLSVDGRLVIFHH